MDAKGILGLRVSHRSGLLQQIYNSRQIVLIILTIKLFR